MSSRLVTVVILSLAVSACGKAKTEPNSVAYFLEHRDEMKEVIRKANADPGKYKDDPDVINAVRAKHEALWGHKGKPAVANFSGELDKLR